MCFNYAWYLPSPPFQVNLCLFVLAVQLCKSHYMDWITLKPKLLKCPNRIILAAKSSVSSSPRQSHTAPALPKIFFILPGNSSLWELQMLSRRVSEQDVAGVPQTTSPSEHVPACPVKPLLLCQVGWEPTLSSYVSLAPAHPQNKTIQVYSVCQAHSHIKGYCSSTTFIIQLWSPWGIPK